MKCSLSFAQKTTFGSTKCLSPHKATIIHKLYNTELNFVNWYVRVCGEETDTIPVLFSDEAWFHCSGYVNIQHKILMYVPCILYSFF